MAGQVKVRINKTYFDLAIGAQFFVPRGNQYQISNTSNREAVLYFFHASEVEQSQQPNEEAH
eukprot:jgi/Hompol1/3781/HPOL_006740-RA